MTSLTLSSSKSQYAVHFSLWLDDVPVSLFSIICHVHGMDFSYASSFRFKDLLIYLKTSNFLHVADSGYASSRLIKDVSITISVKQHKYYETPKQQSSFQEFLQSQSYMQANIHSKSEMSLSS